MDTLSPKRRSENMRRIKSTGMKPEMAVRRLVHRMGYRYRLHDLRLPGKPDLVFPSRRKVIFVHGCFWHQHPSSRCGIVRRPKSNRDYWNQKLKHNRERDARNRTQLRRIGWKCLVIWECQIGRIATLALRSRISRFLSCDPLDIKHRDRT
ncbi:DNA mismatch endonuclease Vsr [Candidatus Sumerlaeota bacterium]|nr:DNA mismatch endonuclease Vsr [Candidatus Sumerlaeota bacterium]MBI3736267.1 DNA mismatch endonuclease Vsr [Candidatus Sumerlaeota bacterium]